MMGVSGQGRSANEIVPSGARVGAASAVTGLHRRSGRKIAGEVAGIDVQPFYNARKSEADHRRIVATTALAPRLPAIHPFSVIVEPVYDKDGGCGLQHAVRRGKELIGT